MALMTEVCWRMKQVTSTVQRQAALLLGRLGRDERMFGRVTASQIASASLASFLWRLFT